MNMRDFFFGSFVVLLVFCSGMLWGAMFEHERTEKAIKQTETLLASHRECNDALGRAHQKLKEVNDRFAVMLNVLKRKESAFEYMIQLYSQAEDEKDRLQKQLQNQN